MTSIVAFDIIGTCFSLEKPRQKLAELNAPTYAIELWFSQTLRDAFAISHAGSYQPLKQVLEAELPRTLKMLDIKADSLEITGIIESFSELELHSDALESFEVLKKAGCSIVALSNGSENSTRELLIRAGAIEYFDRIFSCDAVLKTKPHPDVYALLKQEKENDVWMVAAHAWDIAGAALANLRTAFVTQVELDYLSVYPQPEVVGDSLVSAANKIVARLKS